MKKFESFMAQQFEEFLDYRESVGYSTKTCRSFLHVLDRYLQETNAGWESLDSGLFFLMRANLNMESRSVNRIISTARAFFQFLIRREYISGNPLQDITLLKENTIMPFVFSPEQIDQLLEAICKRLRKSKGSFLKGLGLYTAILLMARCGLRISEPLRILRKHYRRDDKTIYIDKTKFKKSRLIPVPNLAIPEIENYLSVRQSLLPHDDNPYLLAGRKQKPLTDQQVGYLFRKIRKDIGLDHPRKVIGNMNFSKATPHSLRHSFATNTLIRIKERGGSTQHALPVLAAYMGHRKYKDTTVYLKFLDAQHRQDLLDFAIAHQDEI
jgi:site-specific recombinase XerD